MGSDLKALAGPPSSSLNRRGLLTGIIALCAAPAIVRAGSIMPVKVMPEPRPYIDIEAVRQGIASLRAIAYNNEGTPRDAMVYGRYYTRNGVWVPVEEMHPHWVSPPQAPTEHSPSKIG